MAGLYSSSERAKIGLDAYAALGATRTKATSTLFVRHAPRSIKAVHIESLFSAAKGYIGVRHVRSMFFIDFESIAEASNAMVRFQGYRHALAEARPARPAAAAALSRSRRVEPIAKLLPC